MSEQQDFGDRPPPPVPAFRAPGILVGLIAALFGIHLARQFLGPETDYTLIATFALFPARYAPTPEGITYIFPGGLYADLWTPITYAFLHGDWLHLFFNAVWLLAFGTPVARRLGTWRFIVFYLGCAVIAGVAYAWVHAGLLAAMIGASGAISGIIAGAALFVFEDQGPIARLPFDPGASDPRSVPRRGVISALSQPRALIFTGVWLGFTLLFGVLGLGATGETRLIAWEAHLAGFVAGLILFPWLDPGAVAGSQQHRRFD